MVAFAVGGSAATAATYSVLSSADLPQLPGWLVWSPAYLLASTAAAAAVAKVILGDMFHITPHKGRLYMQVGVPSDGPPMQEGAVVVRPTGDVRGNGAFAVLPIPKGSYIVDYEGELLDWATFDQRFASGESDFVMALDSEVALDASGLVPLTATLSGVHLNHSRVRPNVVRYYDYAAQRIKFFASRDIFPGEELLYDYGRAYWRGREQMELP